MLPLDFRKVAEKLRNLLAHVPVTGDNPVAHATARHALVTAEHEMAVQSFLYLWDHYVFHEQWMKAAYLVAFGIPQLIEGDPRLKDAIAETWRVAKTIETPEMEVANFYLEKVNPVSDALVLQTPLQGRAEYWIRASRLSGAERALEFACGDGTNVMQAFRTDPMVTWCGMDVSKSQVAVSNAQAKRLGIPAMFAAFGYEGWKAGFDTVAVLDCLEHSAFPHEILLQAEEYCHEKSVLIVSVPQGPWSLFTPNKENVGAGQHIGTASLLHAEMFLATRGRIVDASIVSAPTFKHHGNSVACVAYEPASAKGRKRREVLDDPA